MGKQCSSHPFTGKMAGTIGYKVNGEFLERENGSKTGKAFRKDKRRWRTMLNADLFRQASKAMRTVYKALPASQHKHGAYGKLTGKAFSLLKEGKTIEAMKEELIRLYVTEKQPLIREEPKAVVQQDGSVERALSISLSAVNDAVSVPVMSRYVVATVVQPYFCSTVS